MSYEVQSTWMGYVGFFAVLLGYLGASHSKRDWHYVSSHAMGALGATLLIFESHLMGSPPFMLLQVLWLATSVVMLARHVKVSRGEALGEAGRDFEDLCDAQQPHRGSGGRDSRG